METPNIWNLPNNERKDSESFKLQEAKGAVCELVRKRKEEY